MARLPFTEAEFLQVFSNYNAAIWPAQFLLLGAAASICWFALRTGRRHDQLVSALLAALWGWTGIVYYLLHFAQLIRPGIAFGLLFIVQALLFLYIGVYRRRLHFTAMANRAGWTGLAIVLYALIGYPLVGHAFGQRWPAVPSFGAPCPLTIFTFGVLLWITGKVPRYLLIIPVTWALIGSQAALSWGIVEDWLMPIAAVLATVLILHPPKRRRLSALPV